MKNVFSFIILYNHFHAVKEIMININFHRQVIKQKGEKRGDEFHHLTRNASSGRWKAANGYTSKL